MVDGLGRDDFDRLCAVFSGQGRQHIFVASKDRIVDSANTKAIVLLQEVVYRSATIGTCLADDCINDFDVSVV